MYKSQNAGWGPLVKVCLRPKETVWCNSHSRSFTSDKYDNRSFFYLSKMFQSPNLPTSITIT